MFRTRKIYTDNLSITTGNSRDFGPTVFVLPVSIEDNFLTIDGKRIDLRFWDSLVQFVNTVQAVKKEEKNNV